MGEKLKQCAYLFVRPIPAKTQVAAPAAILAPRKPEKVSGKALDEANMIYQCLIEGLEIQRARLVDRVKERFTAGDKMAALEVNVRPFSLVMFGYLLSGDSKSTLRSSCQGMIHCE